MKLKYLTIGTAAIITLAALAGIMLAPRHASAIVKKGMKNVLVVTVTKGFRHDSIQAAEETIELLGKKTGEWNTDFVRTDEEMQTKMTAAALKKYDCVVFANTTGVLPLPDPQGFLDYIKEGHGFAAMHSGSDTFHQWPGSTTSPSPYGEMLGGEFLTHHAQCAIMPHIADPKHPALKSLTKADPAVTASSLENMDVRSATATDGKHWKVFDEIYLMKNNDRTKVHVLLSLDKYPNDGSPEANSPGEHLIAWCKAYGKGRVFYTELGHRKEVWHDHHYQEHIIGGLEFALGLSKGDTKPSPAL